MTTLSLSENESITTKGRNYKRISAYALFQKDSQQREKVKETLGDTPSIGDISKGMSQRWKTLDDTERQIYQELAKQAKQQNEKYTKKRARSAYTLFTMNDKVKEMVRNENPGLNFSEFSKVLSEKWKSLSDSEKEPYQLESNKEKDNLSLTNSEKPVQEQKMNTRQRARTPYVFYIMDTKVREEIKKDNPEANFGSLSKLLAAKWKTLSEQERLPYQEKSLAEKQTLEKVAPQEKVVKERKRARTAYTFYTMDLEVRQKLRTEYPDAKFSEFSKILSKQWKILSEEDKKTYQELSKSERLEMQNKNENKKAKQKRGRSAYTLYSSDASVRSAVREAHPDATFGDISKILSQQWKELDESVKKPYIEASNIEKAKTAADKVASKPPKTRAKSAYLHYSMNTKIRNKAKQINPNISVTELAKILGQQWRELSDKQKKPFQAAYEKEKSELTVTTC